MTRYINNLCAIVAVLVLSVGCANQKPLPFELVDANSSMNKGTIFPDGQRIEATIDGQLYTGFYLVATQVAYSETFGGWRSGPRDTVTTSSSNSVRAHLVSPKGEQLNCEFLFESRQAIGECKSPSGKIFQLAADGLKK